MSSQSPFISSLQTISAYIYKNTSSLKQRSLICLIKSVICFRKILIERFLGSQTPVVHQIMYSFFAANSSHSSENLTNGFGQNQPDDTMRDLHTPQIIPDFGHILENEMPPMPIEQVLYSELGGIQIKLLKCPLRKRLLQMQV